MTLKTRHSCLLLLILAVAVAPGVTAAAGSTDVALEPTGQTVTNGEAATFDVVVTNASGGVGAANISFSVANDTAAITQVAFSHNAAEVTTTYASDNSSATLTGYGLDTNQTGQVVVATVTVEGNATSTAETTVTPEVNALGDEDGNDYTVGEEQSAQLEITTSSSGGGGDGDDGDDSDSGGGSGDGGDGDTASTTVTNFSVATTDVETGESVEATATVLNDGDVTTNATVNLTVDGTVRTTKTVADLEPGTESAVVFLPVFEQAGTYNLTVGGESVAVTVAEPTTTPDPVTTETPTETESQAPGFGVLSALVSLVALVGAARLRAQ
ncbi:MULTISPECIES: CARDB domain-containing protein [unclassified Haloferax]|uniref:CARDB domain-containing protein n=1 Tax=unclassified Haloferax TaxID=2625095 RepID=UPI001F36D8B1|nr:MULTISPECIES: CARDB domain-containing protein [unclassified Haloferax]